MVLGVSTEKDHLAAVVALMGGTARGAYSLGDLDAYKKANGALPPSYNEVHVMERLSSGPRRSSLPSQTQQWRIFIRSVGQVYANAQEMRRRASELHEARMSVAGEPFGIERSTTDDPIGPDSGWWSGTSEYVY